jgi:hypothetical protein
MNLTCRRHPGARFQRGAAIEGLGLAPASLSLIKRDPADGRLVCPVASPC